jgi:hypothetical protein
MYEYVGVIPSFFVTNYNGKSSPNNEKQTLTYVLSKPKTNPPQSAIAYRIFNRRNDQSTAAT